MPRSGSPCGRERVNSDSRVASDHQNRHNHHQKSIWMQKCSKIVVLKKTKIHKYKDKIPNTKYRLQKNVKNLPSYHLTRCLSYVQGSFSSRNKVWFEFVGLACGLEELAWFARALVWKSLRLDTRERDFEQNSTTLSISAILNDKTGLGRKCDNSENTIANNLLNLA